MQFQRVTNRIDRRLAPRPCRLRVIGGADAGLEIGLPPIGVVLGADPGCDVVLRDPAVSGRHCSVVHTSHGFEVTDLGSRNGTFVDEVLLSRATLPMGSTLRVGTSLVQLLPAEHEIELAPSERDRLGGLFGASIGMRKAYAVLERASQSSVPILIGGESGTGKELAARAAHEHSTRPKGPFVVFDCGAATSTLIESDLFGHRRGAFTGAATDRVGAFACAHQGTLFLDEIGDLPLSLQPKLLRMLETGEISPLGGSASERYDVRVIAATHRDLAEEVTRGAFRGDLYYRLAVVEVHLPPLRHRREDLPMLVRRFLELHGAAAAAQGPIEGPSLSLLEAHAWPGNVRELRNVIGRAVALGPPGARFGELPLLLHGTGAHSDAELAIRTDRNYHDAKAELLGRFERTYLADLLARSGGNLSQAARLAGLERKYLYVLLRKAGLLPRATTET